MFRQTGLGFGLILLLTGCAIMRPDESSPLTLRFLDEYVVPSGLIVDGMEIGGLSDLDFDGTHFYTVCDLPSAPVIFQFSMPLAGNQIDTVIFEKGVPIERDSDQFPDLFFDSEGLVYHLDSDSYTLSSEGSVKNSRDPFIAEVDPKGRILGLYDLPSCFDPGKKTGPRNNGVFEGLDVAYDGDGIWAATELPLKEDGKAPRVTGTFSPVRFTYFDRNSKKATRQFAYPLDRLRKFPLLPYGINGVTAILEYEENQFLVLERGFSAGYGKHGFRVLLYHADARNADSTLDIHQLKNHKRDLSLARKQLLFDFNSIRKKLTRRSVDNLEGMALGPRLPNGNRTLVLIADNNFNRIMPQMNQIILLEIVE